MLNWFLTESVGGRGSLGNLMGPLSFEIGFDENGQDESGEERGRQDGIAGDVAVVIEQPPAHQRQDDAEELRRGVQQAR